GLTIRRTSKSPSIRQFAAKVEPAHESKNFSQRYPRTRPQSLGKFKASLRIEQHPRTLTTDISGRKQEYPMRVHFHSVWFGLANIRTLKSLVQSGQWRGLAKPNKL